MQEIEIILEKENGEKEITLETEGALIYPPIEDLKVTPTKEQQVFNHNNSYGYDEVIVEPIPDEYIIPDGMLPITENTTYDVRKYARVSASVHPTPTLQDKSITITENGTQNITYDVGYDGLNSVEVTTNVGASSSKITNLTELDDAIENCGNALLSYYDECIKQYPSDTNEPATLYSPATGFNSYVIRYRNNGYQIVWFSDTIIRKRSNTEFNTLALQIGSFYFDYNGVKGIKKWSDSTFIDDTTPAYISSTTFSTLQDAINGMKDNTIAYTSSSNRSWGVQYTEGVEPIPYTNMAYLDTNYDVTMTSRRISSNEIIEVI